MKVPYEEQLGSPTVEDNTGVIESTPKSNEFASILLTDNIRAIENAQKIVTDNIRDIESAHVSSYDDEDQRAQLAERMKRDIAAMQAKAARGRLRLAAIEKAGIKHHTKKKFIER